MSQPIAYGIDFGTTNSLVSVAYRDGVDVIMAGRGENPENLPSLVYLHRDGVAGAGVDAVSQYTMTGSARSSCAGSVASGPCVFYVDCKHQREGGGCNDSRIVSELKAFLSDPDIDTTHSWGRDFALEDLVAVILRRLKTMGDRYTGSDVRRAVIGHPIAYPGAHGPDFAQRQRTALERMKAAAAVAGFDEVVLYQEPAAAVLAEQGTGTMLAVDFGGGTFDVAILRMSEAAGEVLALRGVAIGGEDFDAALFQHALREPLRLDRLPKHLEKQLSRLSTTLQILNNPGLKADLRGSGADLLTDIVFGGHSLKLFRAIESAKVQLSTSDSAVVDFLAGRPGQAPLQLPHPVSVTRTTFDQLIREPLDAVFEKIHEAMQAAGVGPEGIDLVLRTGGSSAIPAFRQRLEDLFGAEKVQERPTFATIVAGLGQYGRGVWS